MSSEKPSVDVQLSKPKTSFRRVAFAITALSALGVSGVAYCLSDRTEQRQEDVGVAILRRLITDVQDIIAYLNGENVVEDVATQQLIVDRWTKALKDQRELRSDILCKDDGLTCDLEKTLIALAEIDLKIPKDAKEESEGNTDALQNSALTLK